MYKGSFIVKPKVTIVTLLSSINSYSTTDSDPASELE